MIFPMVSLVAAETFYILKKPQYESYAQLMSTGAELVEL